MSQHKPSLLHIATVGRTVGLHGDMKFHIKSDFDEQFKVGATFMAGKGRTLTISHINLSNMTIRFVGYDGMNNAKPLTNVKLFTTYDDTRKNCPLKEGEFFWFDLIGCSVVEDGELLGSVKEVERISINDYLSITTDEKQVQKGEAKSFLLPYLPHFIVKTELENKTINVKNAKDILQSS